MKRARGIIPTGEGAVSGREAAALLGRAVAFRRALLGWYDANARRLPWRERPSLYGTVVSEFMLQQTQVKTVLPYFERWMRELPGFADLAAAPEERVLRLWEGLGYYSRARNLRRLAQAVVARGGPPATPDEWRELPGVGPYTAAAITSIALGARAACVDGNVVRILARLTADGAAHRDSGSAAKVFTPLAEGLLDPARPGDHNQAMMELGATLCSRPSPACVICPVREFCAGAQTGDPARFPRLAARTLERREVTRVWCRRGDALLLHRAAAGARRLSGMHELPTLEQAGLDAAALTGATELARRRRGITRFVITETIVAPPGTVRVKAGEELVWVPAKELVGVVLSGPHRRWINEILARDAGRDQAPKR
ncbi:MAG: A/G-specific adenine glycosylase [Opitutaceae bacterium]